jgi:chaperonin GroES
MKLNMLGNTVLLEQLAPARQSPGGIHYAGRHHDDRMQYWVLAVGPGKLLPNGTRLCPEVRVGDKCLLNSDAGGVRHTLDDGRIVADADAIQMIWH